MPCCCCNSDEWGRDYCEGCWRRALGIARRLADWCSKDKPRDETLDEIAADARELVQQHTNACHDIECECCGTTAGNIAEREGIEPEIRILSGIHQRWALLCDGCWKEKYAPGKYRIVETVEYEVDWAESPSAAVSAVIDHEDGMKKHFVAVVDRGCERVGDGETPVGESDGIEDASIET